MTTPSDLRSWLSDPTRIRGLTQAIRAKVPASDVDDVVQSTLADALTAAEPPLDEAAFDRWLFGVARHKIADYYRRNRRAEVVDSDAVATSTHTEPTPESARDLLRWVDQKLPNEPETTRTLEWMMREASGDKLETIAKEHELSAPAVRQRVSRLRRFLREHWAMELAAALGLVVVVTGLFAYRQHQSRLPIGPEVVTVTPTPAEQARKLREAGLSACRAGEWKPCIDDLDRAKELDPAGDTASEIQEARVGATRALTPVAAPSDAVESAPADPSATPVPSAVPPVKSEQSNKAKTAKPPTKATLPTNVQKQVGPKSSETSSSVPQQNAMPQKYAPKKASSSKSKGAIDLDLDDLDKK